MAENKSVSERIEVLEGAVRRLEGRIDTSLPEEIEDLQKTVKTL